MTEREALRRDNAARALRHALWIALVQSQELELREVAHEVFGVLVHVDAIRDRSKRTGEYVEAAAT